MYGQARSMQTTHIIVRGVSSSLCDSTPVRPSIGHIDVEDGSRHRKVVLVEDYPEPSSAENSNN
jgi:hypothetical protein